MTDSSRTDFGNRLVQSRKRAGLTQAKLGRLVGMTQGTVAANEHIAHGSVKLAQFASVLGVNPLWLATGRGSWNDAIGTDPTITWQPPVTAPSAESVPAERAQEAASRAELHSTPLACELAAMFDLLTDRIDRSVAYNRATQQIMDVLTRHDSPPDPELAQRAPAAPVEGQDPRGVAPAPGQRLGRPDGTPDQPELVNPAAPGR